MAVLRPNLIGDKSGFNNNTIQTLTKTIMNATDTARSTANPDMWIPSATLEREAIVWTFWSEDTADVLADQKNCIGLFLSQSSDDNALGNLLFTYQFAGSAQTTSSMLIYPVFGRTDEATPVQSDAAPTDRDWETDK